MHIIETGWTSTDNTITGRLLRGAMALAARARLQRLWDRLSLIESRRAWSRAGVRTRPATPYERLLGLPAIEPPPGWGDRAFDRAKREGVI